MELTTIEIKLSPSQADIVDWALTPHTEHVQELIREKQDYPLESHFPEELLNGCQCAQPFVQFDKQYNVCGGDLILTDHQYCIDDFIYRLDCQLREMAHENRQEMTFGKFGATLKAIDAVVEKIQTALIGMGKE